MSDIVNACKLWVCNRHSTFLVLAPGPTGTPQPIEPSQILYRAEYVSIPDASRALQGASSKLENPHADLLAKLPSPDGPPAQTAILFSFRADETISYVVNARSVHGVQARRYEAVGPNLGYPLETGILEGNLGYFLIGSAQAANLWRAVRIEVDHAQRYNFTLLPLRLSGGLPIPDFDAITDQAIRQEIQQHWSEFQDALARHRYYGVVTSAKNTAESVLYYLLLAGGHISAENRTLAKLLEKLGLILSDATAKTTVPLDFLAYHLIQKMRILHGRTHPGRVKTDGRAIEPELALTVAMDLVEVLRCAGFVR